MYFFWENYAAATNLQIVFNNPKIPTYSIHPRKYSPNFPTEKNSRIKTFKSKRILWSSPSLEIRSNLPPLVYYSTWGPQWWQLGVLQRRGTFLAPFYLVLPFLSFYLDIQLRSIVQPAALCEIEVYYFTLGQENPVDGYDRDCHHFIISFQSVASFFGCFASHVNCDWCI